MNQTAYTGRVTNWSAILAGAVCATVMIVLDGSYDDRWRILTTLVASPSPTWP